jgi:purine-binding chemotaxis protein CheW
MTQPQSTVVELEAMQPVEEYLIFHLDEEKYGLDILRVAEIRCLGAVTHLPNQADYLNGVLNLRGTIIPVIDLRVRLGMARCAYTSETIVIVTRTWDSQGERKVGVIVDVVSAVAEANAVISASAPEFGSEIDIELIRGLT